MTSAELYARARALDLLADDVEVCVDPAVTVAASPAWDCANADDVRTRLRRWRQVARDAAAHLRAEAGEVRAQARRAAEREEAARREAARREAERREAARTTPGNRSW